MDGGDGCIAKRVLDTADLRASQWRCLHCT